MAFLDHEGGTEYPYPKEDVFKAILHAIPKISGMKIDNSDLISGRIMVKSGVSLTSWGENVPITLIENSPGKTRVNVISTPKTGIMFGGALDFGKNRKNIERIFEETSKILSKTPPYVAKQEPTEIDPTVKLAKLKEMFEKQLITKEEFESKKSEILSKL